MYTLLPVFSSIWYIKCMMVTSPTIPMNTSVRYVNRFGESVGVVGVAGVFASIFCVVIIISSIVEVSNINLLFYYL